MNVHILPAGPIPTNAYLVVEPSVGEAVLVDAPPGVWPMVEPILKREGCRLSALWLTHGHWDHTQGAPEIVRRTGVPVFGHRADRALFEIPGAMRQFLPPGMTVDPLKIDRWLEDGESLDALGQKVGVRHVPGHCPGSLMFYFPAAAMAFTGDALFRGNVGRSNLPGGDPALLKNSIQARIYTLPDQTKVFPGHGESTTVGEEKATNPYVRG